MKVDFAEHVKFCTPRIYPYECQSTEPTFIKNKGVFQNYHRTKPHILINHKKRKFDVLVATVDVDCKDNYKAIHFMHQLNKGRSVTAIENPTQFLLNHGFVVKPTILIFNRLSDNTTAYGVYHNGLKLFSMKLPSNFATDDVAAYAIHFLRKRNYLPVE